MRFSNLLKGIISVIMLVLLSANARATCEIKESTATTGGNRELLVGKHKLVDVDTFKKIDEKVFYATIPIYGKPELGMIDCSSYKRTQLVAPKNIDKFYPDGTDFFRLRDVKKDKETGTYTIRYFYAPDVDRQDFKNLEIKKNLKSVKVPSTK